MTLTLLARAGAAAFLALLSVGCAATAGQVATPISTGASAAATSGTTPPAPNSRRPVPNPAPTPPTSAEPTEQNQGRRPVMDPTIAIRLTITDAGVDGVRGERRIVIRHDGRVTDSGGDAFTYRTGQLADGGVTRLFERAAELDLLGSPDAGDPMVTDSPSLTLELRDSAVDTLSTITVHAPDYSDGLDEPELLVRQHVSTMVGELTTWQNIPMDKPLTPTTPPALLVWAHPLTPDQTGSDPLIGWPLDRAPRELFEANACQALTDADVDALMKGLTSTPEAADQLRRTSIPAVTVATGTAAPTRLRLTIELGSESTQCAPPGQIRRLAEPWPAQDRRAATTWESWIGEDAVFRAANAHQLGSADANTAAKASHYPLTFSAGRADGVDVIDVIGGPHPGGDRDPNTFSLRVEAESGRIIKLSTG